MFPACFAIYRNEDLFRFELGFVRGFEPFSALFQVFSVPGRVEEGICAAAGPKPLDLALKIEKCPVRAKKYVGLQRAKCLKGA